MALTNQNYTISSTPVKVASGAAGGTRVFFYIISGDSAPLYGGPTVSASNGYPGGYPPFAPGTDGIVLNSTSDLYAISPDGSPIVLQVLCMSGVSEGAES